MDSLSKLLRINHVTGRPAMAGLRIPGCCVGDENVSCEWLLNSFYNASATFLHRTILLGKL